MNNTSAAVTSSCFGSLDRCSSAGISGWAVEDGRPAVVNIFAGDNLLKTLRCEESRPDLEAAGLPPNSGFLFKASPQLIVSDSTLVSVQFSNGSELSNSPRPFLRHDGHLDHGNERGLSGWATRGDGPAELEVYVADKLVGTICCTMRRDDVEATLRLGHNAGFEYTFPSPVTDASVSVRFHDGAVLGEYTAPSSLVPVLREYEGALAEYRAQTELSLIDTNEALRRSYDFVSEPDIAALLRARRDILEAGLFDPEYYMQQNPDVCASGMEALDHYLRYGEAEDRRPNEVFRPSEYVQLNQVRLGADSSALAHYSCYGERHGLRPSLAFDPKAYLDANRLLRNIVGRPLFHYLRVGRAANLRLRRVSIATRTRHKPRIVAQLAVKNEVELVERTISHLRNIGVDHIVACDIASTDGTREILERHRSSDFWVEFLSDEFNGEKPLPSEVAAFQRYKDADADWVIFLDADEFWIPASGNLKDCETLDLVDVLSVPRFNVVLGPSGPQMPDQLDPGRYDELLVIARPFAEIHERLTEYPNTPWIMGAEAPKIMARTKSLVEVTVGEHEAVMKAGAPICRARASDLFIAHLPLTSRRRFQRKISSIASLLDMAIVNRAWAQNEREKGGTAWHWWRWAMLEGSHEIDDEFDKNTFSKTQLDELRQIGVIRSAAEILAEGLIEPAKNFRVAKMQGC